MKFKTLQKTAIGNLSVKKVFLMMIEHGMCKVVGTYFWAILL